MQAEPDLAEMLLRDLPDWAAHSLRKSLRRRILTPDVTTLAAFCALATERARLRDPSFPPADPSRLVMTLHWFAGERFASDQRQDGKGWVLFAEDRDIGPAEVCHEDEWRAEAHGQDCRIRVYRLASGGSLTRLYEEDL